MWLAATAWCCAVWPLRGEAVPVDEKTVPFFTASKELRGRLNCVGTKHRS
jgi:hypothetical protein